MKILIVDDHPIFVDGLKSVLISNIEPLKVLQASNVSEAIEIVESSILDLILLDFKMPELDGMDFLKAYFSRGGLSPVAMISSEESPELVQKALKLGAGGFIPKSLETDEFLLAIQLVLQGKQFLTRSMKLRVDKISERQSSSGQDLGTGKSSIISNTFGFTARQLEVLELIDKGYTNKHISSILHISVNTVKEHVHNIFQLMDVSSRGQCIAKLHELRVA